MYPEEAIYAKAQTGLDGQPLNGTYKCVMHFDKGKIPPVDASGPEHVQHDHLHVRVKFDQSLVLVDQTTGLMYNPDGSLDIYIRHDATAGKESNWLLAPEGSFYKIVRMYQPGPAVLKITYQIPQVQKVA